MAWQDRRITRAAINLGLILGSLLVCGAGLEAVARFYEARLLHYVAPFIPPAAENDLSLGSVNTEHPEAQLDSTWDADGNSLLHVRSKDGRMLYELRPGVSLLNGLITTNRLGFREREFALEKPAGVCRIAVVGDSLTFGWRLALHETYPKVLESLLCGETSRDCAYEVLNLGIGGYDARQEIALIRSRVLAFQPDLIIVGYCWNDNLRGMDGGLWWHFWRGRSAFLSLAQLKAQLAMEKWRGKDLVESSYEELAELLRGTGIPVVLAVLPLGDNPDRWYSLVLAEKRMKQAQQLGFHGIEFETAFVNAGLKKLFFSDDDLHPNAEGHRILAQGLYALLKQHGLLGRCGPDRSPSPEPATP